MTQMVFDRTTGRVAREAGVSTPTVRLYANMGLLTHMKASDGTRLFTVEAAELVRSICRQRLDNRGRRPSARVNSKAAV